MVDDHKQALISFPLDLDLDIGSDNTEKNKWGVTSRRDEGTRSQNMKNSKVFSRRETILVPEVDLVHRVRKVQ